MNQITKVSTYLIDIFGRNAVLFSALFSRCSMNRLATTGNSGDPIAAPSSCSKNNSPNWKYVERRQRLVRWQISGGGRPDLSSSVSSCSSQCEITSMASVSGTLVNRLTTSKLTVLLFSAKVVPRMRCAKAEEFFTCDSVFLSGGVRILASSLAKL